MQKIEFVKDGSTCRVIEYDKKKQQVKVLDLQTNQMQTVAFAHIPKNIKKLLNPL